jgi:glycosyltransferase involved in cell wall biosynthesis
MITIGMPLFNAEDFLEEALDSLLAQSFCDFKLIISDNASADGTEHICRRYAKADSRITYTRQASNQGGIANFCSVLKAADTPYFMWAAGDDIWAPEYIEMCIANLQADPELGLVASIVVPFIDDVYSSPRHEIVSLPSNRPWETRYNYLTQPEEFGKANLIYGVYRTELIKKVALGTKIWASWGADMNLVYSCLCVASLHVINRPLFFKRQTRSDVITAARAQLSKAEHEQIAWRELCAAWENYLPYYWNYLVIDARDKRAFPVHRLYLVGCSFALACQKLWPPLQSYLRMRCRHSLEKIKGYAARIHHGHLRNQGK